MLEIRQPLSEKYRPRYIRDFIGLERPRQILTEFVARPCSIAWLFVGPSGVGKTTMGLALADEVSAELHHIPAKACRLETVEEICERCHYYPHRREDWKPCRFHLVLADEADGMTGAAQSAFLSKLDATAPPPTTIFVFTANATHALEDRFLSRCQILEFTSDGIKKQLLELLPHIWAREAGHRTCTPDFGKIIRESNGNVRTALNLLESALIYAQSQGRTEATRGEAPELLPAVNTQSCDIAGEFHPLAQLAPGMSPQQFATLKSNMETPGARELEGGAMKWKVHKEAGFTEYHESEIGCVEYFPAQGWTAWVYLPSEKKAGEIVKCFVQDCYLSSASAKAAVQKAYDKYTDVDDELADRR